MALNAVSPFGGGGGVSKTPPAGVAKFSNVRHDAAGVTPPQPHGKYGQNQAALTAVPGAKTGGNLNII